MNSSILVYLLLIFGYCWVVVATTDSAELAALRSLRQQWKNTPPNWRRRDPCGQRWEGIYCNGSHVIDIILPGMNITGPLPEEILLFPELQTLDLSNNRGLSGPLPSNTGRLTNLISLVLVDCSFSGPIPESIGSLQKLAHLFLNVNHFSGNIPHSIGNLTNLIWLDLSNNQLNGTLPVSDTGPGLNKLLRAKHFHFGQNELSGEIPLELFSSRMALIHIIVNDNQLSGSIPDTLGLVRTLTVIRLDRNSLSGPVPPSFSTLPNVTELYLANNNLNGSIPNLTDMSGLRYVDLSNNSFDAATVPEWVETLPLLTTLLMENTGLTGPLPMVLLRSPRIQSILLRNNQLNGTVEIAASIGSSLRLLDLRNNLIEDFSSRASNLSILLDENPFCLRPEAAGICITVQPETYLNFISPQNCIPSTCFSDPVLADDCRRPYLGNLVFRSFNFSDLENMRYYDFLRDTLQPLLESRQVPIDEVCLVSSMIDRNGYLLLNISFFASGGAYFNRTGISTIGNVLNNHTYPLPYGPYYYSDVPYTAFPGQTINTGLIIGLTISGFVLLVLTIASGVYAYRQRKVARRAAKMNSPFSSWNEGNIPQLRGAKWLSLEDVKQFTSNFSYGNEIGVGGYGKVYKGKLGTGELVAIKRAQPGSKQGASEFKTEIELLSRVHHKNVVNLVGFCYDKGEQMLIYEYVPNGSLRAALSGKSGVRLSWSRRLQITLGAARGLAYLHELADPPIIHRDIKSDNILLDDHLNAKVADFGLSTLLSDDRCQVTTQVKGTLGYLDPEYYMTQRLTEKSDVYSFGVVMLELLTGKIPLEQNRYIVRTVKETLIESGDVYDLLDPIIRSESDGLIVVEEFVTLAMKCAQDMGDERPSMNIVVKQIETMIEASNLNYDVESTTTSASYTGARESGYSYSSTSNTNVSFESGMNSSFLR